MRRTKSTFQGLIICLTLVVVTGCGVGDDDAQSGTTTTTTTLQATSTSETSAPSTTRTGTAGPAGEGTCPDEDALADLLGGPIEVDSTAGASMSGSLNGSISYSYTGCEAELVDGDGRLSVTRVGEVQIDGEVHEGSAFEPLSDAALADFEEDGFELLAELGVDAYRDGNEVVFLSGEAIVFVEVDVDGEPSVDAAVEVAAALADASTEIPNQGVNCRDLMALMPAGFGAADDVLGSGGSTIIGDLQFTTSGCTAEHDGGYASTIMVADGALWDDWVAAQQSSSFASFYTELDVNGRDAFDDGEELVVDDGASPWVITASGDDLVGDPAAVRLELAELAVGA